MMASEPAPLTFNSTLIAFGYSLLLGSFPSRSDIPLPFVVNNIIISVIEAKHNNNNNSLTLFGNLQVTCIIYIYIMSMK